MKEGATPYTANKMTLQEKSKIIFEEIYGSELYWNLRCKVKDELLKNKAMQSVGTGAMNDMITKMVRETNLEPELKNKVYEIYESLLKEETAFTWASYKLKDCQNLNAVLPAFYTQQQRSQKETLESIVQAKSLWDEYLKQRVENLQKTLERPMIRRRAEPVEPGKMTRKMKSLKKRKKKKLCLPE